MFLPVWCYLVTFTKPTVAIICALFLLGMVTKPAHGAAPSSKTATQTTNKPNKPKVKGGYPVSVTTGWREINGWEQSLLEKDPNLKNWNWLGMREMNKNYMHLRPGQNLQRRSVYRRPKHISPTAVKPKRKDPRPVVARDGVYMRPTKLANPTRSEVATNARLSAPAVNLSLAAPSTKALLAVPATSARLAAPSTSARLAAPTTQVRLAAPTTQVHLAAPTTQARLASQDTHAQLASKQTNAVPLLPRDEMSGGNCPEGDDTFQSPELQDRDIYGPRTHKVYGTSTVNANVRGKLVKNRAR